MRLLELSEVTKRFGRFVANDDVSLAVDGGEVVGLLGANGAGKTTAIRQALGLLTPNSGTVSHFGEVPSRHSARRIGYLPQGLGLWTDLSVLENLRFVAQAYGSAPARLPDDLAVTDHILVRDLSLGQQRRVAFCAALGHDPELLVLDEPTSGVDALSRSRLWDVIRGRAEAGAGVLVTTHFMDEARQCDRLLIMNEGRIVLRGSDEQIVGDRRVVQVDGDDWASFYATLETAGFDCGLVGRSVRVLTEDSEAVLRTLTEAGLDARVSTLAATLEETMVAVVAGEAASS